MKRSIARMALALGVALVMVLSFGSAQAQSAEDDPEMVEAGMAVFEANCAGCHGADGMGTQRGRDLTDVAVQQPDRLVHIDSVTNGKGFMPAFGENLSAEDIDAAISYVRLTFVSEPAAEAVEELAATGSDGDITTIVGVSLVAAGALMVLVSRRRETPEAA